MFNGYVLYLQAVTTPNPFVKLPKLPFHKSLLLIFCLRLRFPFSFFKLFFAAAALVIFPGWLWLFSRGGLFFSCGSGYFSGVACFSCGSGYFPWWPVFFPAALVISPGWLWFFSRGGLFFRRLWLFSRGGSGYFPGVACFSGGSGYFPGAACFFPAALVIFPGR